MRASAQFKDICPNSYDVTSLLLYNKFSQNYWHETIHVYYLTGCVAAGSLAQQGLLQGFSQDVGRGCKVQLRVQLG